MERIGDALAFDVEIPCWSIGGRVAVPALSVGEALGYGGDGRHFLRVLLQARRDRSVTRGRDFAMLTGSSLACAREAGDVAPRARQWTLLFERGLSVCLERTRKRHRVAAVRQAIRASSSSAAAIIDFDEFRGEIEAAIVERPGLTRSQLCEVLARDTPRYRFHVFAAVEDLLASRALREELRWREAGQLFPWGAS